jgi:hypothetical protein
MTFSRNTASGAAQESRQDQDFPDYDDAGLAARLRQSVSTVRTWRSNQPDRLPPGVRVGRTWLYDKNVVEKWLAAKRESAPLAVAKVPTAPAQPSGKRRGKPSKQEVAAAKAMGLTVPVWRARQEGSVLHPVGDAKRPGRPRKTAPTQRESL